MKKTKRTPEPFESLDLPKPLPRDEQGRFKTRFTANGNEYLILNPSEPMGIERWALLEKFGIIAGTGRNFAELVDVLRRTKKLLASGGDVVENNVQAILLLNSLELGIVETNQGRHPKNMFLCTLFIIRDGEDLSTWSETTASEKIEDWTAENISEHDFFLLSRLGIAGFNDAYQKIKKDQKERWAKLGAFSQEGTTKQ